MSLFSIMDVSGSALRAQSIRLNTVASNMANAESVSGSAATAYKAKLPVFAAVLQGGMSSSVAGVEVQRIHERQAAARRQYAPDNPMADENGFIYFSNVSAVEEMSNMISASRSFQSNVEVMNTAKQLMMRTLTLGK